MKYKSRETFGKLFQSHFKLGVGAEIGVQNGFNTLRIAKFWQGNILCVDVWEDKKTLKNCKEVLKDVNCTLIKSASVDASLKVKDNSLDWVYIDADHSYESVKADYLAWYKKVRKGGIISGHDYGDNDCIGVKTFIDELMLLNPNIKMNFTTDDFWEGKEYQSWWFKK